MSRRLLAGRVVFCALVLVAICGCKPRLDSGDPKERRKAVDQYVNDEKLLELIATSDPDLLECAAAVEKLKDPVTLERVARHSGSSPGKDFALARIRDQEALARIASAGSCEAVVRVTDDRLLAEIVRFSEDSVVRSLAIKHLKDDAILQDLYSSTGEYDFLRRSLILSRRVELRGQEAIDREMAGGHAAVPERSEEARAVEGETEQGAEEPAPAAAEAPASEAPAAGTGEPAM